MIICLKIDSNYTANTILPPIEVTLQETEETITKWKLRKSF